MCVCAQFRRRLISANFGLQRKRRKLSASGGTDTRGRAPTTPREPTATSLSGARRKNRDHSSSPGRARRRSRSRSRALPTATRRSPCTLAPSAQGGSPVSGLRASQRAAEGRALERSNARPAWSLLTLEGKKARHTAACARCTNFSFVVSVACYNIKRSSSQNSTQIDVRSLPLPSHGSHLPERTA